MGLLIAMAMDKWAHLRELRDDAIRIGITSLVLTGIIWLTVNNAWFAAVDYVLTMFLLSASLFLNISLAFWIIMLIAVGNGILIWSAWNMAGTIDELRAEIVTMKGLRAATTNFMKEQGLFDKWEEEVYRKSYDNSSVMKRHEPFFRRVEKIEPPIILDDKSNESPDDTSTKTIPL